MNEKKKKKLIAYNSPISNFYFKTTSIIIPFHLTFSIFLMDILFTPQTTSVFPPPKMKRIAEVNEA